MKEMNEAIPQSPSNLAYTRETGLNSRKLKLGHKTTCEEVVGFTLALIRLGPKNSERASTLS